ncbi:MAG: polysulfide reductase NrfD [Gammaproteobacteria bacterium]|nr:polysulfide reductase NrfD [Gammaproteobacteria bacterium]
MKVLDYSEIEGRSGSYIGWLALLGVFLALGGAAALTMEHYGHAITGMNNQVVWGMPHVFAVFLIVAASGALNVASIASVFGKSFYKPLAPLSGLLAIALLVGGLAVLVLDLGRPDRLIVAMTYYNFKSIFAWNIILYTGFIAVVYVYLWMMMERRFNAHTKKAGVAAFSWRLILTTGTGSIFGFLVARSAYDTALMAPMFIIMSLAFGTAIYLVTIIAAYRWTGRELGFSVIARLRSLLGTFVAAVLLIVAIYHLTNLYITQKHDVERFILADGGVYTALFWVGQVFIGGVLPLWLCWHKRWQSSVTATVVASLFVVLGGLAQMYVIIIGGQVLPLEMFPGFDVTSGFSDGQVARYTPSVYELFLGLGGVAIAGLVVSVGVKILRFLPVSLADSAVDPHVKSAAGKQ